MDESSHDGVEFLPIKELFFLISEFLMQQEFYWQKSAIPFLGIVQENNFLCMGYSHTIHNYIRLKISLACIFTHYFEIEFENFQIYQPGQFFNRLSYYIIFYNKIFHDQRISVTSMWLF